MVRTVISWDWHFLVEIAPTKRDFLPRFRTGALKPGPLINDRNLHHYVLTYPNNTSHSIHQIGQLNVRNKLILNLLYYIIFIDPAYRTCPAFSSMFLVIVKRILVGWQMSYIVDSHLATIICTINTPYAPTRFCPSFTGLSPDVVYYV